MNHTLFIGPYRQRDLNGIWSRALAHNIINGTSNNVQLRPFFIDRKYAIDTIDDVLCSKEKNTIQAFDTVVQHVPIEQACAIDAVKNNVLIPIISPDILGKSEAESLSKFSSILVDNKNDSTRLSQAYPLMQKSIKHMDYAFSVTTPSSTSFNVGLLDNVSTKLYMVCSYRLNSRMVYDTIVSFIANLRSKDMILVLFALDISVTEKNELEKFIQDTYKAMNIGHTINRVVVAPITSDLNNINTAHRSGNVFIDIADYGSTTINNKLASAFNNTILKIIPEYQFSLTNHSNNISDTGSLKISSESINTAIKKYIQSKNVSNQTILFKTHHINKYI
jgi:hypothetical protein